MSVAITTHYSSDQPKLWIAMNKKHQQCQQRFESQAAVIISGSRQHLTMHVKGRVVQSCLAPVHGSSAAEKRRHLCPFPPARQQWEVRMLSPHLSEKGSSSSSYPIPVGLQRQKGQKAAPSFLQAANQPREKGRTGPRAATALPGYPSGPGVQRKTPQVSPMHLSATAGHGSCLFPQQLPIPPTALGLLAGPEQQQTAVSPSLKIPYHFFPLTPSVIY